MVSLPCPLCAAGRLLFFLQDVHIQGREEFCLVARLVFCCGHRGAREDLSRHGDLP